MIPVNQLPSDIAGLDPTQPMDEDSGFQDSAIPDDSGMDVQEQPDGSAIVIEQGADTQDAEFRENMAETLSEDYLGGLGRELCEAVENDKAVREERDKQYAEGIKRTGLGNDAPGGASFDGASRAVHPMLAKGCVEFASRAIKELYPANGPCKTKIIGDVTDAKLDRAERKKEYMNWQLMTQVPENRAEFERLLSQLPLGGSQYKRWWYDPKLRRNRTEVVYIDDVFMPYGQADFYTSARVTHRQRVTPSVYASRIASGLYRDLDLSSPGVGEQDESAAQKATDRVEGAQEEMAYDKDGLREIYQIEVDLECEEDAYSSGETTPYILHVDAYSQRVLGMYRNWAEEDDLMRKKHWMVEYNFIPWRGAYGVGLTHLIGSLAASGTGAVRAILDAAHIQNFPGGLKLKGGRNSGQSVQVNATELAEIEGVAGIDDIRKMVMPFPFNGPSQVLFNLLEWLTQQAEGVVSTASERIAEGGGANMPVGTAMALIENDSTNFSAIHARLHNSLQKELEIVHRLNAEYLTQDEVIEDLGELVVRPEDFQGPMDIIPVSDPNIFSEGQRYAQLQAVMQLQATDAFKPYFKADRLLLRALKLLQIQSPEELANLPKDPQRLCALDENYAVSKDQETQLKVYDDQDDMLHLQTHIHFMTSPIFGGSILIGQNALPPLVNHCRDHLLALYKKHTHAATDAIMAVAKMQDLPITREDAEGRAAALADQAMAQALGPMVMPGLQQSMQAAQGMQSKPPASPDAMLMAQTQQAIAQAKDQGDTQRRQMELQSQERQAQATITSKQQADQLSAVIEQSRDSMNERIAGMTAQLDLIKQNRENQSKALLAEMQGQNQQQLVQLQAYLDAQLKALPDFSGQIGAVEQRAGQVTESLGQQIADLQRQRVEDQQTIVKLLTNLHQTITASATRPRGRSAGPIPPV